MPFGSSQWMYASGAFYNGVATQSARFDDGSSADLTKTFGSGNQKTWTWSCWVKRSALGGSKMLLSNYTSGTDVAWIYFNSSNQFYFQNYEGGTQLELKTNALYRDVSSWYHVVVALDTTQATASNRAKIYINGEQITSFATSTYPSQNADLKINTNSESHKIGSADSQYYFDGYMAEVNFVDGSQLDPTSFGETKNGVWIAKAYTGSYGTNGFRLEFKNTSVGSGSSSTIGADTSGNDNHYTSSGIVASDCDMPDSPENNFCTFNSVGRRYGQSYIGTFSEGNLSVDTAGQSTHVWGTMAINQIASQGGVYFEIRMDSLDTARTEFGVIGDTGTDNKSASSNGAGYSFPIKGLINDDPRAFFTTATDGSSVDLTSGNTAFSNGDVAGIAILSDGKFFCHRNGTYLQNSSGNTGNPSTGTNEIATIDLTLGDWVPFVGFNSSFSINFGQDGSFSGNETSGGYQDANNIGDFMFAVPTNCLAICSSNMTEPTISPNASTQADDYFNTVLYTGNGSTGHAITGVGFQPDWTWIKGRSYAGYNYLVDSVRGYTERLFSNLSDGASVEANTVTSSDSDGFTLGSDAGVNNNTSTYVAWNWKAGGTAVSNTDGTITSSVSANTDAGFSIVSYTGNATASTIGHGLNKTPSMVIVKERGGARPWVTYHASNTSAPETDYLRLNETNGTADFDMWNDTAPTSSVFSVSSYDWVNNNASPFIAYCFAEIEGYSKFGSYTGNGSTDGTFVYTGFRPAWLMVKRTDTLCSWVIVDAVRDPQNVAGKRIFADSSASEYTNVDNPDFVSNGFKVRIGSTDNCANASGGTYIYMAFAENPFKYANAR